MTVGIRRIPKERFIRIVPSRAPCVFLDEQIALGAPPAGPAARFPVCGNRTLHRLRLVLAGDVLMHESLQREALRTSHRDRSTTAFRPRRAGAAALLARDPSILWTALTFHNRSSRPIAYGEYTTAMPAGTCNDIPTQMHRCATATRVRSCNARGCRRAAYPRVRQT